MRELDNPTNDVEEEVNIGLKSYIKKLKINKDLKKNDNG
jgi:hypothetical protein